MKNKLIYLGFFISQEGLKMDPNKVKSIIEWPSPKNIYEVRSSHGLISFYRNFIKYLRSICASIVEAIKKRIQTI